MRFSSGVWFRMRCGRCGAKFSFLFGFWRKDGFWIFMEELGRVAVFG